MRFRIHRAADEIGGNCIDLGAWASEAYRVESPPRVEDDDDVDLKAPDRPL